MESGVRLDLARSAAARPLSRTVWMRLFWRFADGEWVAVPLGQLVPAGIYLGGWEYCHDRVDVSSHLGIARASAVAPRLKSVRNGAPGVRRKTQTCVKGPSV
jgi:hypothetical protein